MHVLSLCVQIPGKKAPITKIFPMLMKNSTNAMGESPPFTAKCKEFADQKGTSYQLIGGLKTQW
jgi:hypothetical protein